MGGLFCDISVAAPPLHQRIFLASKRGVMLSCCLICSCCIYITFCRSTTLYTKKLHSTRVIIIPYMFWKYCARLQVQVLALLFFDLWTWKTKNTRWLPWHSEVSTLAPNMLPKVEPRRLLELQSGRFQALKINHTILGCSTRPITWRSTMLNIPRPVDLLNSVAWNLTCSAKNLAKFLPTFDRASYPSVSEMTTLVPLCISQPRGSPKI